ncbi:MAG TPA: BlaI/MecI/CopY family transcriptional regulator [Gammaproteobacteria bacterium]
MYQLMRISEAESRVMEVFWRAEGPLSADDVVAPMGNDRDWSAGTIRTFLTRLLKKKALAATRDGRRYLYRALIRREDYVHEQSRRLLDRLFGGRIAPFVTHFSERQALSRAEVEELKRLIERLDHDR